MNVILDLICLKRSVTAALSVLLLCSSCRTGGRSPTPVSPPMNSTENFVRIATIDDRDSFQLASTIEAVLRHRGINSIVEGSVVGSVLVEKKDAHRAAVELSHTKSLVGRGLKIEDEYLKPQTTR